MEILLLISLLVAGCSSTPRYVIMAPNVFHVGVPQKIHVALYGVRSPHNVEIEVRVPVLNRRSKVISSDHAMISKDKPRLLTLTVSPEHISHIVTQENKYVFLLARCKGPELYFSKNAKVLLSYRDGVILIQTDKPIYTPKQSVKIRVVPLGFNLMPSTKKVNLIVKNPQGIAVQQWKNLVTTSGFISKRIDIGSYELTGNWTVEAYYGHLFVHNALITFEVRKYIVPKFFVNIKGPRNILTTDTSFNVSGNARYIYGKKVQGTVAVRLHIVGLDLQEPMFLLSFRSLFYKSTFEFTVQMDHIKNLLQQKWFPEGYRLQIEADVTEKSTGKTERAVENSIYFVTSPYRIEYVNTAQYFKPGLPFSLRVRVTYPNKEIAARIPMELTVKDYGKNNKEISSYVKKSSNAIDWKKAKTDEKGVAEFTINVARKVRKLIIKVKTKREHIPVEQNAVKTLVVLASESNELMKLRQKKPLKVGSNATCEAVISSNTVGQLSYFVVSRGQIVYNTTIDEKIGIITTIFFKVIAIMSPSARLVAYYISDRTGEIVSDSILLEVEDEFPNQIFLIPPNNNELQLPSDIYNLKIVGTIGTKVSLLGVDQSVYLQSKRNILTPESVFKNLEDLDYGCGAGSGRNSNIVFKNTGLVVISHNMVVHTGKEGCKGEHGRSKRSFGDYLELDDLEPDFDIIPTRSYFPKTWIFRDITIRNVEHGKTCSYLRKNLKSKCGSVMFPVSLPDTMTTWVVQTMGVSSSTGFGIAKPLHITTFKHFFIHLSMPYSVQRGEEISILATMFNYRNFPDSVYLYLKGDEGFCSIALPGTTTRLTNKSLTIKAQDSVSFSITIVPIKYGNIPLEVTAIGYSVDDKISKELLVVPEGVEQRLTQSYLLDPKEFLKGRRQQGENQSIGYEELSFASTQTYNKSEGAQINTIKLVVPKNAIPESITAKVYLDGNFIGQALTNLAMGKIETLLQLPYGSGEQNMRAIARNVYVFYYFTKTKQMTPNMENKKNDYIQKGYIHELDYRKNDGSFTSFRQKFRAGSTWLTAFVVKVFCQANQMKGVSISKRDLCQSANWVIGKQRSDGAFIEKTNVIYLYPGGVYTSNITLTAAVVIALKQCQCGGLLEDRSFQRASAFLERSAPNIVDAYSLAITTYALTLVNSTVRFYTNQKLIEMATYNPATSSRHWETGSRGRNVETAGYALLVQVSMNRLEYAGPIIFWLTKQRRFGGGFVSTADTSVVLESLAKYSERAEKVNLDMKVRIKNRLRILNKETALLQQEVDIIPYVGEEISIETRGTGVGKMTVDIKYNVPSKNGERCDFHSNVTVINEDSGQLISSTSTSTSTSLKSRVLVRPKRAIKSRKRRKRNKRRNKRRSSKNRKNRKNKRKYKKKSKRPIDHTPYNLELTVCTRYKKSGNSGMAVIEVGVLTGYHVKEDTLMKLINKENNSISRYELIDRAIVFFVDQIDSAQPLCLTFSVIRLHDVGGIQSVPVKVYHDYKPDNECTISYNLGRNPKFMGRCRGRICRCTQGTCPEVDPRIDNIDRTLNKVCRKFDFAIKGKVVLTDEDNMWLTNDIKVMRVIKQGYKRIKTQDVIEFRQRNLCKYPMLRRHQDVLIMGRDKSGQYIFDYNAFVKILVSREDMRNVDELAKRIANGRCT